MEKVRGVVVDRDGVVEVEGEFGEGRTEADDGLGEGGEAVAGDVEVERRDVGTELQGDGKERVGCFWV